MTRVRKVDDHDWEFKGRRGIARKDNPTPATIRSRKYRDQVRAYLEEHKQPCLFCGCEDNIEYHHYNTTIKPKNMMQLKSIKAACEELDRVWQLCFRCHNKLHLGSVCPLPECYD